MSGPVCAHCKATLPAGATKCAACGEWLDGRWRLDGAGKIFFAAIVGELCAMVIMAAQWLPAMRSMLGEFGGKLPAVTELVLDGWWMPLWIGVLAGLALSALALVKRARRRVTLLAIGFVVGVMVLCATIWGAYAPVWALAGSIK